MTEIEHPLDKARRVALQNVAELLWTEVHMGRQTWDTEQMKAEFDVQSFLAPFVVVIRKSDGQRGTLMFQHAPRVYFAWEAAE